MFTIICPVLLVLVLFWVIVITVYILTDGPHVLKAAPQERDTPEERERWRQREVFWLEYDLRTICVEGRQERQQALVELGIAENRTTLEEDEQNELPGEVWLCERRPLWFALFYQLPPSIVLTYVSDALFALPVVLNATVGVLAATLAWIVLSIWPVRLYNLAFMVQENTRMGVKRMGRQLNGYLRPGLQFTMPWVEQPQDILFQAFVWGPHTSEAADDDFHINGVAGNMNPSPGLFKVPLRGRWMFDIVMQITVRFRKARKDAWWSALNRYKNFKEIGEQIAGAISAVLFTYTREIVEKEDDLLRREGITTDDPRAILLTLLEAINNIPEISGKILKALQQLGDDRLGGVLPIGVALVSATPSLELQQLLQTEDEAQVKRYRENLEGQAVQHRLQHFRKAFGDDMDISASDILRLDAQEVQRLFALAGGQTNSLEALIRAVLAGKVQNVTGTGRAGQNNQP